MWYVVKNCQIIAKVETHEDAVEYVELDMDGDVEIYPEEALISVRYWE